MNEQKAKKGLGALFQSTSPQNQDSDKLFWVRLEDITPNPNQPRTVFEENSLAELANSIKEQGVLQPLLVKPIQGEENRFELIAGERRWRAAKLSNLTEVPVIVKNIKKEADWLLLSLIENIQRNSLNPIEEALAYKKLADEYNLTQEEIAVAVSKNRSTVANSIRLLDLPDSIKEALKGGSLSVGIAKILLGIPNKDFQIRLASKCQAEGLTVRQLEGLLQEREKKPTIQKINQNEIRPAHVQELENKLSQYFGTRVSLEEGRKKGKIIIEFFSVEDFDRIVKVMGLDLD